MCQKIILTPYKKIKENENVSWVNNIVTDLKWCSSAITSGHNKAFDVTTFRVLNPVKLYGKMKFRFFRCLCVLCFSKICVSLSKKTCHSLMLEMLLFESNGVARPSFMLLCMSRGCLILFFPPPFITIPCTYKEKVCMCVQGIGRSERDFHVMKVVTYFFYFYFFYQQKITFSF